MSKVLILGAKGMLGQDLTALMQGRCAQGLGRFGVLEISAIDIEELDITDAERVGLYVRQERPDLIINCAAHTDVDGCETERDRAFAVNADGAGNLANAAREVGALLTHISTDFIFGGTKHQPYLEDDAPDPLSIYGQSKLAGEQAVQKSGCDYLIVRTAWLYGKHGKNFVHTILDLGRKRCELKVVDDQWGSPTWTVDLAEAIRRLLEAGARGVFHASGGGYCSWYEFACEILKQAGINVSVKSVKSAEMPRPARRPAWSVLGTGKLLDVTGYAFPDWRERLRSYLTEHVSVRD